MADTLYYYVLYVMVGVYRVISRIIQSPYLRRYRESDEFEALV